MRFSQYLCCLLALLPFGLAAQGWAKDTVAQRQRFGDRLYGMDYKEGYYQFWRVDDGRQDTVKLLQEEKVIYSTGNPIERFNFCFVNKEVGFLYGHEVGYGIWPFLFRTSDGGLHWERKVFDAKENGPQLHRQNFFMFDERRGILIAGGGDMMKDLLGKKQKDFQYYTTSNGGNTWHLHKKRLKVIPASARIENYDMVQHCTFDSTGKVDVYVLTEPWNTGAGKRSIEDRKRYRIYSEDFGKSFSEEILK
jgi:hypothetical protein